jgi:hypothetical protein
VGGQRKQIVVQIAKVEKDPARQADIEAER